MMLHPARYLALDSSHLTQWAHDKIASSNSRAAAAAFEAWLEANGFIPLITLHHIEELVNHGDVAKVRQRLHFMSGLKLAAWIGEPEGGGLGGVTTIMAAEVRCALARPEADAAAIRDDAAPSLLQCGHGEALLGMDPEDWLLLRPVFEDRAKSARDMVALAHTDVVDITSRPVAELMAGSLRQGQALMRALDLLRGSFAVDIAQRGDTRIENPAGLAKSFVDQVQRTAMGMPSTTEEFVLVGLAKLNVVPEDIQSDSTIGEMMELGLFRSQLSALSEEAGWSLEAVQKIPMDQIPAWVIQSAMRRYAPQPKRRSGSELNDFYMACLAPYADVTFVDKRIREGFDQAFDKRATLAGLTRRVECAARYDRIPKILADISMHG